MTGNTPTAGEAQQDPREDAASTPLTPQQRTAHDESLAAIHELEQQVTHADQAAGQPIPSQPGGDDTGGTGI